MKYIVTIKEWNLERTNYIDKVVGIFDEYYYAEIFMLAIKKINIMPTKIIRIGSKD